MYLLPPLSIKSADPAEFSMHYFTHFQIHFMPYNILETYHIPNCLPFDEKDLTNNQILLENFHLHTVESDLNTHGSFFMLLAKFFRNVSDSSVNAHRFHPVFEYIAQHINENIQIETLADIMHVSKIYFTSLFSQTFNISPMKYILEKRIFLAQELLMTSSLSVREIAEKLGYSNEYYFSTSFKRILGISPSKWRNVCDSDNKH